MSLRMFHLLLLPLCALLVSGCPKRQSAGRNNAHRALAATILIEESEGLQQIAVWTRSRDGNATTFWLSGNRHGSTVIGSREGITLPVAENLVEIQTREKRFNLCDCTGSADSAGTSGCTSSNRTTTARWPISIDLLTNEETVLVPLPFNLDETPDHPEFSYTAEVQATFGQWGLLQIRGQSTSCDGAPPRNLDDWRLVHLKTGETVDLFTIEEREAIAADTQVQAFAKIRRENGFPSSPHDLSLTAVIPVYLHGLGMTVIYEFSAYQAVRNSASPWMVSHRTVEIEAKGIPSALLPLAIAPDALLPMQIPADKTVGGWTAIHGTAQSMQELFNAIVQAPSEESTRP